MVYEPCCDQVLVSEGAVVMFFYKIYVPIWKAKAPLCCCLKHFYRPEQKLTEAAD